MELCLEPRVRLHWVGGALCLPFCPEMFPISSGPDTPGLPPRHLEPFRKSGSERQKCWKNSGLHRASFRGSRT
ncbi:unnamed protein product, partial [Gulo gulo]